MNHTQEGVLRVLSFEGDNFLQRRASQSGAGVAYDPESLLTGEEMEAGLDYDCPRVWPSQALLESAQRGEIPTSLIPTLAPRAQAQAQVSQVNHFSRVLRDEDFETRGLGQGDEEGGYPLGVPHCESTQEEEPNYICTRKAGHSGPHAAHGLDETTLKVWNQEPQEPQE